MRILSSVFIILVLCIPSRTSPAEYHDSAKQIEQDTELLYSYVQNIEETMRIIREEKALFSRDRVRDFDLQEREKLYSLWGALIDYLVALDSLTGTYSRFYVIRDRDRHEKAFAIAYASYITKFSTGMRFISRTIDNELYEKKLDDVNTEYGIPAGMYAKLKWNTIHVRDVTAVLAGYQYFTFLSGRGDGFRDHHDSEWLRDHIESEYSYIAKELKLKGPEYFVANGRDIMRDRSFSAWFPLQVKVSGWLGDTKVKRQDRYFISHRQVRAMDTFLRPGDIIVTRRNWYLSNIGLPGFWPHAALYIGTHDELKKYFDDEDVTSYYRSLGDFRDFMDYLRNTFPKEMKFFEDMAGDGFAHQVIEAVSEGVKFSSLEEAAAADYAGVMRPRLTKLDIAKAVAEAFRYVGRPYDFNFDFLTDSTLVCSELIYKVYLSGQEKRGLHLQMREIAGRQVIPPIGIVREFDSESGTPEQELDFVYFLDGSEEDQKAFVKGLSEFRQSHRRLKWDLVQK